MRGADSESSPTPVQLTADQGARRRQIDITAGLREERGRFPLASEVEVALLGVQNCSEENELVVI
jgi:hypothetical protein